MLVVNKKISIPLTEFEFTFSRSPGPGGQNVNKVNTKVTLRWRIEQNQSVPDDVKQRFVEKYRRRIAKSGELILTSHRFRDQGRNVADCLNKLRELLLAVAEKPVPRKKKKISKSAKKKRLDEKRRNSEKKHGRKNLRLDD